MYCSCFYSMMQLLNNKHYKCSLGLLFNQLNTRQQGGTNSLCQLIYLFYIQVYNCLSWMNKTLFENAGSFFPNLGHVMVFYSQIKKNSHWMVSEIRYCYKENKLSAFPSITFYFSIPLIIRHFKFTQQVTST